MTYNPRVSNTLAAIVLALTLLPLVAYTSYRIGRIVAPAEKPAAAQERPPRPSPAPIRTRAEDGMVDPAYLETNVSGLIRVHDLEAIQKRRQKLAAVIWGPRGLQHETPAVHIEPHHSDPRYDRLRENGLRSIQLWTVEMEFGIRSLIYRFVPREPRGPTVLIHQGHRGDFILSIELISAILGRGHEVFGFAMPLNGMNNHPTISFPRFGRVKLSTHDTLKLLKPREGHPVQYLLEPVLAVLNEIRSRAPQEIAMVGISGGGWTTTLMAALDPRIRLSIPVAGSYPLYLRSGSKRDWGDWEQTLPELYRAANYPELYVMGAAGKGRRQLQILNKYDPCCFAGVRSRTYREEIGTQVTHLQAGSWDLFLDDSHVEHAISKTARARILHEIEALAGS